MSLPNTLFDEIKKRIKEIVSVEGGTSHDYKDYRAFIFWFLETHFELKHEDIRESICDGTRDFGIDAIYINNADEVVYFIQSKYNLPAGSSALNRNDAEKSCRLKDYLESTKKLNPVLRNANPRTKTLLENAYNKINSNSFEYKIIFLTTDKPNPAAEDLVRESFGYDEFQFRFYTFEELKKIQNYFKHGLTPTIGDHRLKFSTKIIKNDLSDYKTLAFGIKVNELKKFILDCRRNKGNLLKANVREFLGVKKDPSKNIKITIKDKPELFFLFHNGITIVCSGVKELSNNILVLDDPQVVNGGQTIKTLEVVTSRISDKAEILVKLIICSNSEIIKDVTYAANCQSPINEIDLRSNDPLMVGLQRRFYEVNYFFKRKEGEEDDYPNFISSSRIDTIDRIKLAQIFYAVLGDPSFARASKKSLFKDENKFKKIFSEDNSVNQYLFYYYIDLFLKRYKKYANDKFHEFEKSEFLTYCYLHIIGLIANYIERKQIEFDMRSFIRECENDFDLVYEKIEGILKKFFEHCYRCYKDAEKKSKTKNVPNYFKSVKLDDMVDIDKNKLNKICKKFLDKIKNI